VPFPSGSAVGDKVQSLLTADATTGLLTWQRSGIVVDDPLAELTAGVATGATEGLVWVGEARLEPKFMGGLSAAGLNMSQWRGFIPVSAVVVARDPVEDVDGTLRALKAAESMMTQCWRVLIGGDQTLGGLTLLVVSVQVKVEPVAKRGIAWAGILLEYEFIASPV
jgi:hypothetical protein